MFKLIHYTNIFGCSTTQLFTKLFPSQFFIAITPRYLSVNQGSFNTIIICIYCKGSVLTCLSVINIYFLLEILSENLFAVSQSITFVVSFGERTFKHENYYSKLKKL